MTDPLDMQRSFEKDFFLPAIQGLKKKDAMRVALALDAAIAFGALEHAAGNESLQDDAQVTAKYWRNVMALKKL